MAPWPAAYWNGVKSFCRVTTRRCNLWLFRGLRRKGCSPTARALGLGVLGFGFFILAPFGLPPRRLPTPD